MLADRAARRARGALTAVEHHANMLPWRRHDVTLLPVPGSAGRAVDACERALRVRARGSTWSPSPAPRTSRARCCRWPSSPRLAHRHGAELLRRRRPARPPPRDRHGTRGDRLPRALRPQALRAVRRRRARRPRPASTRRAAAARRRGGRLVTLDDVIWADAPARHEAGTPNVVGAVALGAACRTLGQLGMDASPPTSARWPCAWPRAWPGARASALTLWRDPASTASAWRPSTSTASATRCWRRSSAPSTRSGCATAASAPIRCSPTCSGCPRASSIGSAPRCARASGRAARRGAGETGLGTTAGGRRPAGRRPRADRPRRAAVGLPPRRGARRVPAGTRGARDAADAALRAGRRERVGAAAEVVERRRHERRTVTLRPTCCTAAITSAADAAVVARSRRSPLGEHPADAAAADRLGEPRGA